MFALEALQAHDGDCLLLHYQRDGGPAVRLLIDGGSKGIYRSVLKPRLEALRGAEPLDLRMVIVSHIDADHITGIVDLFRGLTEQRANGEDPSYRIQTLWHNAFKELQARATAVQSGVVAASLDGQLVAGLDPYAQAVVASVPQGNELRNYATQLAIPINAGVGGAYVLAPETGQLTVDAANGLRLTVLAPHKAQLDQLEAAWVAAKAAHPADPAAQAADYLNNTAPNMSSIVVLADGEVAPQVRKRMLLTGDARGDVILSALDEAGVSQSGHSHFDVLKVQHHASSHSSTEDFFARVTADRYVISGNGKMGNPHPDAMRWLSKARHGQRFEAFLTNRTGDNDLGAMFDAFLKEEARDEPDHVYHFRTDPAQSITVELGS